MHREQSRLVEETLRRKGFEQARCYFAMRYWHPFTEDVSELCFCIVGIALLYVVKMQCGVRCAVSAGLTASPSIASVLSKSVVILVILAVPSLHFSQLPVTHVCTSLSLPTTTRQVLRSMQEDEVNTVVVVPLYPHYSVSTSGSSLKVTEDHCQY
jgi:hypothetical protein